MENRVSSQVVLPKMVFQRPATSLQRQVDEIVHLLTALARVKIGGEQLMVIIKSVLAEENTCFSELQPNQQHDYLKLILQQLVGISSDNNWPQGEKNLVRHLIEQLLQGCGTMAGAASWLLQAQWRINQNQWFVAGAAWQGRESFSLEHKIDKLATQADLQVKLKRGLEQDLGRYAHQCEQLRVDNVVLGRKLNSQLPLEELQQAISALTTKIEAVEVEIKATQDDISAKYTQRSQLMRGHKQIIKDYYTKQQDAAVLRKERAGLRAKSKAIRLQLEKLESQKAKLIKVNQELRLHHQQLQTQLQQLPTEVEFNDLTTAKDEIVQLQEKIAAEYKEQTSLQQQLEKLTRTLADVDASQAKHQQSLQTLRQACQTLRGNIATLNQELPNLSGNLSNSLVNYLDQDAEYTQFHNNFQSQKTKAGVMQQLHANLDKRGNIQVKRAIVYQIKLNNGSALEFISDNDRSKFLALIEAKLTDTFVNSLTDSGLNVWLQNMYEGFISREYSPLQVVGLDLNWLKQLQHAKGILLIKK